MRFAFYDRQGREYYYFLDNAEIPIVRKLHLTDAYIKLFTGISDDDVRQSLAAIDAAINETDKKGNMSPNIGRIGYICTQLLSRSGRLLHTDVVYRLAALYFIRSDEKTDSIDETIVSEKIEAIKSFDNPALHVLFFEKKVSKLFPFIGESGEMLSDLLSQGTVELNAYVSELKQYVDGRDKG